MSTSRHIIRDRLSPKGCMEMFVTKGKPNLILKDWVPNNYNLPTYRYHELDFSSCELQDELKIDNIIVNIGKDAVIESLTRGYVKTLARMSVGDNGTIPSDSTVPKTPVPTMTALYNEVTRADADALVLNIGTPTIHEVKLIKTFVAADIPITSFFNQAKPVLNEVGLIMIDLGAAPLPRAPNFAPYTTTNHPLDDEVLFAIRTHKSVPFEASNDISVTIRYTIYIE
jgi:hypothetical protein